MEPTHHTLETELLPDYGVKGNIRDTDFPVNY